MLSSRRLGLILALLAVSPVALAAGSEWKTISGTNIRLLVPEGFAIATTVKGFQSIELQSTLMAQPMPATMEMCRVAFTKKNMAARGWTLLSRTDVKVAGSNGLLAHLEVAQQGRLFRKWITIFPDAKTGKAMSVHGVYPKDVEKKIGETLKESVLSAGFADAAEEVRTKALPFALKPPKPLAHAKDVGPSKIYTENGLYPLADRDRYFVIVAPSMSTIGVADRKGYAKTRVTKIEGTKDVKISRIKEVEIDGLPGFEVQARGKDAATGESIFVYQVILYEEVQYYLVVGIVKHGRKGKALTLFRKAAATFVREKPEGE